MLMNQKVAYVSCFSTMAAVNFRVKSLDNILKFDRVLVYNEDRYGFSKSVFPNQSNIPIKRSHILFPFYALYIVLTLIRVDVVIFLKAYPANILAAFCLRLFKKKIIFDFDEMDSFTQLDVQNTGLKKISSYMFWRGCEVLAIFIGNKFIISNNRISGFIKNKPYFYLPNCVNILDFISEIQFDASKHLNIIYAGSFHEEKELLNIFAVLDKKYTVILMGDGLYLKNIYNYLTLNGFDCHCYGYLNYKELICKFKEIRGVYLAPYRDNKRTQYSSSGKMPMYMITGCPIIVSDVEGPLDYERGENIFYKYSSYNQIPVILDSIYNDYDFNNHKKTKQMQLVTECFNYEKKAQPLKSFLFQ
jgi:glycosyltransferase involved in cell wall biosynthesis